MQNYNIKDAFKKIYGQTRPSYKVKYKKAANYKIITRYFQLLQETISTGETFTVPNFATFSIALLPDKTFGTPIVNSKGVISYQQTNNRFAGYYIKLCADSEYFKENNIKAVFSSETYKKLNSLLNNSQIQFHKRLA
jgi:nucleoid DNA-binding protein